MLEGSIAAAASISSADSKSAMTKIEQFSESREEDESNALLQTRSTESEEEAFTYFSGPLGHPSVTSLGSPYLLKMGPVTT